MTSGSTRPFSQTLKSQNFMGARWSCIHLYRPHAPWRAQVGPCTVLPLAQQCAASPGSTLWRVLQPHAPLAQQVLSPAGTRRLAPRAPSTLSAQRAPPPAPHVPPTRGLLLVPALVLLALAFMLAHPPRPPASRPPRTCHRRRSRRSLAPPSPR